MTGDKAQRLSRIGCIVLTALSLPLGVWAVLAPRSFYDDFPGFGRHWVAGDGPYNEHLIRDFGGLNLALAIFTICAAIWVLRPMVIATALAWIAWPLPHVVYHAFNVGHYDTGDQIGIVGGLVVAPMIGVALLVMSRSLPNGSTTT